MLLFVFLASTFMSAVEAQAEYCLVDNTAGCGLGRPPIYLVTAPRRIRPDQVLQMFATILRMEYGQQAINLGASIVSGDKEIASTVVRFERPSSRIMQLKIPANASPGKYKLRLQGRLDALVSGSIFRNETDIEFSSKKVSVFIQMSRPLYRQQQTGGWTEENMTICFPKAVTTCVVVGIETATAGSQVRRPNHRAMLLHPLLLEEG
ncbi:CD109 antigen [Elysia marginata]|uniref:CD109 antigen n=1 Tax=Elysia marginata TaxID=1093978 RepID=A0AAV4I370_9GAST|nr:CD109 antigen [Elysia marginata]